MGKNDKQKKKHNGGKKHHTAKNDQKPKNDQNKPESSCSQQSNNEEVNLRQECSVKINDDHIQIGHFKLTNVDLRDIVRKSEQIQVEQNGKALTNDPKFMEQLDAYAQQKSEEIINSTVKTLPTTIDSSGPTQVSKSSTQTSSSANSINVTNRIAPNTTVERTVNMTNPPTADAKSQTVRKVDAIQLGREFLERRKQEPPLPPPKVQPKKTYKKRFFGDKLVNPNGQDSPFVAMPIDIDSFYMEYDDIDAECTLLKEWPALDESMLYYEQPDVIAKKILDPNLPYSFPFTIEVFFALTGIRRRLTFLYSGPNTFKSLSHKFRHKHCESENFQMFYLNHDGRYMEVHDNFTLKQMLITHGAYPRGAHCPLRSACGKVWCIPTTSYAEELIFERERDLIMGLDSELMEKRERSCVDHLPFALSADFRFAEVYHKVIHYSDEEMSRSYNKYAHAQAIDLILDCQRTMDREQLFADCRTKELTVQELKDVLAYRYHFPKDGLTSDQSATKEIADIVTELRKSKHQTREALHMIEVELRKLAMELKKSNQNRRAPLQIFQAPYETRYSGPHIMQTIPTAEYQQLQIVQQPMQLAELIKKEVYADKVVKKQEGSNSSETISKLVEDSVNLAKDVQNLITQRDSLEQVKSQLSPNFEVPDVVIEQVMKDAALLTPHQLKGVTEMVYQKMTSNPNLSGEPTNLSSAKCVETLREVLTMFLKPAQLLCKEGNISNSENQESSNKSEPIDEGSISGNKNCQNKSERKSSTQISKKMILEMLERINKPQKPTDGATYKNNNNDTTEKKIEEPTVAEKVILKTGSIHRDLNRKDRVSLFAEQERDQSQKPPVLDNLSLAESSDTQQNSIKTNNQDYDAMDSKLQALPTTSSVDLTLNVLNGNTLSAPQLQTDADANIPLGQELEVIPEASVDQSVQNRSQDLCNVRVSPTMQNERNTNVHQKDMNAKKND
ncbi:hypothetical protein GCK72_022054 [Caenorhabditis remanei]|uniref:Uncharacterized protein n=1 Tax=Caenorhabditis remanei TaxID=31234 RepID=A0A6A5GLT2_CAERE|nr:hypothetical protein GCK72_022054 [Caenorhabditis remanei]KAF1755485.1 hypothetical protein GCK72_022054 [Caenorhabditis remanei]